MGRVLPIVFNTEMVRAILDGRKTVTRRIIKPQPQMKLCYAFAGYGSGKWHYPDKNAWEYWGEEFKIPDGIENDELKRIWTPPCHTDDILYVRETWNNRCSNCEMECPGICNLPHYVYKADYQNTEEKWRSSIHMPKKAARIWLKVTDVRVERLQDIDDDGILAEGLEIGCYIENLWDSTIKKSDMAYYGWEADPWVWVIEFERCGKPAGEV